MLTTVTDEYNQLTKPDDLSESLAFEVFHLITQFTKSNTDILNFLSCPVNTKVLEISYKRFTLEDNAYFFCFSDGSYIVVPAREEKEAFVSIYDIRWGEEI